MRTARIPLPVALLGALLALAVGCGGGGGESGGGGNDAITDGGGNDVVDTTGGGGDVAVDFGGGGDDAAVDAGGGGDDVPVDTGGGGDDVEEADTGGGDDVGDEDTGGTVTPLVVADDQVADPANEVVVARVLAAEDSWIVIHEDDAGAPGIVLGHAAVTAGENAAVLVTLDRDATDGEPLWAMLHVDAGLSGTWEFPGVDGPVTLDGDAVMDGFVVTLPGGPAPVVVANDQSPDPLDRVRVARVYAAEDGWIVIHEDDGGSPGPVLGATAVPQGESTNVWVSLARDVVDGETLWAMLHVDANAGDAFDPAEDTPATGDGDIVVDGFVVRVAVTDPHIVAQDQIVDPTDRVVVAEVLSVGPGWVVVHGDDGGAPGAVLGRTSVPDGVSVGVAVDLDRALEDGENVWAMLHVDAGVVGVFEPEGADVPARGAGDAVVVDSFVVTVEGQAVDPAVVADDQSPDPANEVVIAAVHTPSAGWIVVHEDDGGSPGPVIGFEAVLGGRNSDVVVTLDRDAEDGETLWAMLHEDTGTPGLYEFPAADAPAVDGDGEIVLDSFVVSVSSVFPWVTVRDQRADPPNVVVIEEAFSVGPGWLVVHERAGGTLGVALGSLFVLDGLSTDLAVTLGRDAVDGETLYARLHIDEGLTGAFEYPGVDAPAVGADGEDIAPTFTVTVPPPPIDPSIAVSDQSVDPVDEVFVDEVFSQGPGWVVIYEDDGGLRGDVIGRTQVDAGQTRGVYVTLDRAATDGETFHAMVHVDAEPVGTFDFPGVDAAATDRQGNVVVQSFTVSVPSGVDPYVVADDQVLFSPNEVTVQQVVSSGPGWVAVYDDDGGSPGTVLGSAFVFDGENFDVVVYLDRDATSGETLWAVLHVDAGEFFLFEYPEPDVPATNGSGGPVQTSFVVTL